MNGWWFCGEQELGFKFAVRSAPVRSLTEADLERMVSTVLASSNLPVLPGSEQRVAKVVDTLVEKLTAEGALRAAVSVLLQTGNPTVRSHSRVLTPLLPLSSSSSSSSSSSPPSSSSDVLVIVEAAAVRCRHSRPLPLLVLLVLSLHRRCSRRSLVC